MFRQKEAFSKLQMEATSFAKKLVPLHQKERRRAPEAVNLK
jgi:hypothetical protein